jgi:hypothetical protein
VSKATALKSEFDVYKTTSEAVHQKIEKDQLFTGSRESIDSAILLVCNHFKTSISNVENSLNTIISTCNIIEDDGAGMDFVYQSFDVLEDYVEFICDDFLDFKETVTSKVPVEKMPYKSNVTFNLIGHRVSDLSKMVERNRVALLTMFVTQLSDEQLNKLTVK